ncbi:peptidase domain-containing ABC transporter [Fluviicola chungangensis]|uniref:Peptidase domain-containing ABC transporter n=1 Tax=Fluviicola chungangensis TaxID=2597671 RepID=A0A556N3J2_9FLAO|nr:peptidase domain-containing ABC transporter [Fluviicola chungangensis]TSJ46722.1 peptidase domain-containing ABC transporter [Fluviicola chungangensis]
MRAFPIYMQPDSMDCGPTCLRMIARHYGRSITLDKLRNLSETTRLGSSLQGISSAAERIGFRTLAVKIDLQDLIQNAPMPCMCFWNQRHYIVLYRIKRNRFYVADPARGKLIYSKSEFLKNWIGAHADERTEEGVCLLLETTPSFGEKEAEEVRDGNGFRFLFSYLKKYRRLLFQLSFGLLASSLLQLIIPFLTQSVVDIGIQNKDIHFLYLILFGQLAVFLGRMSADIARSWILLHLSARINISLVSDFLVKLMKLPISFFDGKKMGDLMLRIDDHSRIEVLLTNQTLNILFSFFNFLIFSLVLIIYSLPVFFMFLAGSGIYFLWVRFFLRKRKDLDYERFSQGGEDRSKIVELIQGIQEIKLHNAERQKRWAWERIQVKLFKLRIKSLRLEQFQSNGATCIHELKNILVSFYTAKLVIDGDLTLGMMLSISYIIGQLNTPISQFLGFIYSVQDAKISLERLNEIHTKEDEEPEDSQRLNRLPEKKDLTLKEISFRYTGTEKNVLEGINLTIESGCLTAIVGASGSGKTTLMKLLLRFYEPTSGKISIDSMDLENFTQQVWRANCGSVMQDGYIFNDTIAHNIALGEEMVDWKKLKHAVEVANIREFIESLPQNYNTKIGNEGIGISGGQKQRILIARAVYKNPSFLFFDEATSSLDSRNEKIIMENLDRFFRGRTAVVIAHRLSTVKNADQIVVLDQGRLVERGTHKELIAIGGTYYALVQSQLDLEKSGSAEIHS